MHTMFKHLLGNTGLLINGTVGDIKWKEGILYSVMQKQSGINTKWINKKQIKNPILVIILDMQ